MPRSRIGWAVMAAELAGQESQVSARRRIRRKKTILKTAEVYKRMPVTSF